MKNATELINGNPSIYGLSFKDYVNGKIIYSEPTQSSIKDAETDVQIFRDCQQAIFSRTKISDGDWVRLKDGTYSRVTVSQWDDRIQIGGYAGSSVYIHKNGFGSHSGSCGDSIMIDQLRDTGEYKEASCWHFSKGWAGAGRGVYNTLLFKVWEQI